MYNNAYIFFLDSSYPAVELCSLITLTWYVVVETIYLSMRALVVFRHLQQFVAFSPRDVCLFVYVCVRQVCMCV